MLNFLSSRGYWTVRSNPKTQIVSPRIFLLCPRDVQPRGDRNGVRPDDRPSPLHVLELVPRQPRHWLAAEELADLIPRRICRRLQIRCGIHRRADLLVDRRVEVRHLIPCHQNLGSRMPASTPIRPWQQRYDHLMVFRHSDPLQEGV